LELGVEKVKTYIYAFVMQSALYWLLLERLWQKDVKLGKIEQANSSMEVDISDLGNERRCMIVTTKKRVGDRLRNSERVQKGITY